MSTQAENQEADKFRAAGHTVLTSGWPDLLVVSPDRLAFGVELKFKRKRDDRWHDQQPEMARIFADVLGVPYMLARCAEDVLLLDDLASVPRNYQPMILNGRAIPVDVDPSLR